MCCQNKQQSKDTEKLTSDLGSPFLSQHNVPGLQVPAYSCRHSRLRHPPPVFWTEHCSQALPVRHVVGVQEMEAPSDVPKDTATTAVPAQLVVGILGQRRRQVAACGHAALLQKRADRLPFTNDKIISSELRGSFPRRQQSRPRGVESLSKGVVPRVGKILDPETSSGAHPACTPSPPSSSHRTCTRHRTAQCSCNSHPLRKSSGPEAQKRHPQCERAVLCRAYLSKFRWRSSASSCGGEAISCRPASERGLPVCMMIPISLRYAAPKVVQCYILGVHVFQLSAVRISVVKHSLCRGCFLSVVSLLTISNVI